MVTEAGPGIFGPLGKKAGRPLDSRKVAMGTEEGPRIFDGVRVY